jgi:DNA-binding CsgD family transcriptional regulator
METERIARLTDQQRACLRLVYAHMTSKEIAPLLGIEPGSVDQHIKAAMRVLGVGDRRAAARLLAEYEESSGKLPSAGIRVQEEQAEFHAEPPRREPLLPLPLEGLRPTHVGWMKRLAWIAAIAIGIVFAFGALIAAAEAFTRYMRF